MAADERTDDRRTAGRHRRVTVVVADASPLFCDALARAVRGRPELELVGQVLTGPDAHTSVLSLRPDVAVIDVILVGFEASRLLEALGAESLATRLLFLAAAVDAAVAYELVGAGAAGYLSKDVEAKELCEAIAAVARGQVVLAPDVQTGLASEIRARRSDGRPLLSERERQILGLVAHGMTAPQMAAQLHLSVGTVKTHLLHVYEKLGVSERAAAVAEAMRRGLLE